MIFELGTNLTNICIAAIASYTAIKVAGMWLQAKYYESYYGSLSKSYETKIDFNNHIHKEGDTHQII